MVRGKGGGGAVDHNTVTVLHLHGCPGGQGGGRGRGTTAAR